MDLQSLDWSALLPGPRRASLHAAGEEEAAADVSGRPSPAELPRIALRWPEEVAEALGVSRSWLYDSGLAGELRYLRRGKVRLVLVTELERVLDRLSARWDE
jgi:hypothetical protein